MEVAKHNVISFLFGYPDEGSRIERESRKWKVIGRWKHNLLANRRRMTSKGRTIKAQVTESGRNLCRRPSRAGSAPRIVRALRSPPITSRQVIRLRYAELGKFLNYESVSARPLHVERNVKHGACQMTLRKRNYTLTKE